MSDTNEASIAEELSNLDKICQRALRDLASTRNVRETIELAEVKVPSHLQGIASLKLPVLQRLPRVRDLRIEEVIKEQLGWLSRERNELVASREFDRLRATDWSMLQAAYPDLYWKTLREAKLILERKGKRDKRGRS